MIGLLLAVVLSVVNDGMDWRIQFTQHYLNVGIASDLTCTLKGKLVWADHPYVDIEGEWSEVITHRETRGIPKGAECTQTFQVKRNDKGGQGDPEQDYDAPGESARITWTEK